MRNLKAGVALTLVLGAAVLPALAVDGTVTFRPGWRVYGELDPADSHPSFGATVEFGADDAEIRTVVGVFGSSGDGTGLVTTPGGSYSSLDVDVLELSLGGVWRRDEGKFNPFYGAGLSHVWVDGDAEGRDVVGRPRSISIDDRSVGIYVDGGVFWKLGERFGIGLDGRFMLLSTIEFRIGAGKVEIDADYYQLGFHGSWDW